jgi:hypothetical protein
MLTTLEMAAFHATHCLKSCLLRRLTEWETEDSAQIHRRSIGANSTDKYASLGARRAIGCQY